MSQGCAGVVVNLDNERQRSFCGKQPVTANICKATLINQSKTGAPFPDKSVSCEDWSSGELRLGEPWVV
jgi:hypothetical protein